MRTFVLIRDQDVSGISGTGKVAEGVEFSDGSVVMRWVVGHYMTTTMHDSIESVEAIHGHDGKTRIEYTSGGIA